jgi:hypothetical protein
MLNSIHDKYYTWRRIFQVFTCINIQHKSPTLQNVYLEHIYYVFRHHSRVLHELWSLLIGVATREALTYSIQVGSRVEGHQDLVGQTC